MLADNLVGALREAGHDAELVTMPFKWYPPDRIPDAMLAARLLELEDWVGGSIDRLIALRFPAYLIRHRCKVLWLLHQHRAAYDLWGAPLGHLSAAPDGRVIRDAIRRADAAVIPECRAVYTISRNVSDRLQRFCGIASQPLLHPPPTADRFRRAPAEAFLLCPGRLNESKRQDLVLRALQRCRTGVRVVFIGQDDSPAYSAALRRSAEADDLRHRVEWRGFVGEEDRLDLFARCLAVLVTPLDEDYGYVTLEAMLAAKPVITCTDSGGPLDFVRDGETGHVCAPEPAPLADAMDRLWTDRAMAGRLGERAAAQYAALDLSWDRVIETLLA